MDSVQSRMITYDLDFTIMFLLCGFIFLIHPIAVLFLHVWATFLERQPLVLCVIF